jgi:prepilin-type processing-associated H-X9-DG protein
MKHISSYLICLLALTGIVTAATDLEMLAQKCPVGTVGFIATSGTEDFCAEFQSSIMGQIASDPQVKSFFEQLFASVNKMSEEDSAEAGPFLDLAKQVFRSPTLLAISIDPANPSKAPVVMLISRTVTDQGEFNASLEHVMKSGIGLEPRLVNGSTVYSSAEPKECETFYAAQTGDFFLAVLNDKDFSILMNGSVNVELASLAGQIPSAQDAIIGYVDAEKILSLAEHEIGADFQTVRSVPQSLGLSELRYGLLHAGFEGSSIAAQSRLKVTTNRGIWNAFGSADRALFDDVDPRAVQSCVMQVNPAVLYDGILGAIAQSSANADLQARNAIAQVEEMLAFSLRDDLLANIEGAFMGYALPAYAGGELMSGGYVATARLRDAQKVEECLLKLGGVIESFGQQQVQVTRQQTPDGKPIHIWAVTVMAMMQIIPSWAIEGDTLIFTSHPSLTKSAIARLGSGQKDGMGTDPRFSTLLKTVPSDAVMIALSDSQANARQIMQGLQQFWPMLNMMLMQKGIQLPIMLPSIDTYIERMEPGLRYVRKTADGIESHYKGTGLEVGMGGAAGAGMAAAILMPALSRTKQIAQRVVSGTNLKAIGTASIIYANDFDGKFPSTFDDLVKEADLSPKSFENPRSPKGFTGPGYFLVAGLTENSPADTVLAYENPAFVQDDQVNVLYTDGHVAAESRETLKQKLKETYEYLGKPMPEIDWGN